jgi:phage shock protein A
MQERQMAESIFMRVRRLISASVEDAVDAMERAGGPSVMREAIREVDRAIDEVRAEQEAAAARRLQAMRQQRMFREKLAALDAQARFAISEKREDLAEAAVSRQLDFEAQAERLDTVQTDAAGEASRLEECLVALTTRKTQMEEALAAFETAQRDAALGGEGPTRPTRTRESKVRRAEEAFDRAMTAAGGVAGVTRTDAQTAAKVAEIATLQKSAAIAQRMAALRSAG